MNQPSHAFLYPYARYQGSLTPENLMFDADLQEFSQRVTYLCNLQTNGKLSPDEVIEEIDLLWNQLEQSKAKLTIDTVEPEE